jgi:hypothetical protein
MFYSRSAEMIVAKDFEDMVMPSERQAIGKFAEHGSLTKTTPAPASGEPVPRNVARTSRLCLSSVVAACHRAHERA